MRSLVTGMPSIYSVLFGLLLAHVWIQESTGIQYFWSTVSKAPLCLAGSCIIGPSEG